MIVQSSDDLTPDRLTALLKERGFLTTGRVASIQCEPVAGPFGKSHQLSLLRVQYADIDGFQMPLQRFFLKFGNSSKEFFFYNTIAKTMTSPPLPRCFYAAYDPDIDQTCLLLEDLSETQFQTEWPIPPTVNRCYKTCQDLAQIHALWWEHPRLSCEFRFAIPPGRAWSDRRASALKQLPDFVAFLGDRLSASRRVIFDRLLVSPSNWWERPASAPKQTLLHGDLHVWNVFYPNDLVGKCYFFDWNMWGIGCPTDDLAYMIAVHWYPERRERMEQDLLRAYYQELVECGITNYSWTELQQDYRFSVVRSLCIPVWQWGHGIHPGVWWSHLERTFLAFEDLKCHELID
jgi:hypothetical protein